MMTEVSLDRLRPLCYFPDFSYKANTFIFYAKVIQRIYIKVGEGQLSRELPGWLRQHSCRTGQDSQALQPAHGPYTFPDSSAKDRGRRAAWLVGSPSPSLGTQSGCEA